MKNKLKAMVMTIPVAVVLFLMTGCAAPDPDNQTARPWNSPTGWEHGLPVGLNEGR